MPPRTLRTQLLQWYRKNARDLPWRRTRDPYSVWVSEIMLQQTRVDTVIPYYTRFLERFPTAQALAAASEDEVMAQWSGLGYYRRARLLHRGVREVVARYGGAVPKEAAQRRELPGVGRYTAGAIGSIAFGLPEPIVEGNVARVFCRLHAIDTPLGARDTENRLWSEAQAMARGSDPGALNQAVMELGATVCTPSSPKCPECPVRRYCEAHRQGRQSELPLKKKRTVPRPVEMVAVLATRGRPSRFWLVRSEQKLFGGLWMLPMAEGDDPRAALRSAGIVARLSVEPAGHVEHVLSHRRLNVRVFVASHASAKTEESRRAVRVDELGTLGISKLTRKLLAVAASDTGPVGP